MLHGNIHYKLPFSIAMFVYRRVIKVSSFYGIGSVRCHLWPEGYRWYIRHHSWHPRFGSVPIIEPQRLPIIEPFTHQLRFTRSKKREKNRAMMAVGHPTTRDSLERTISMDGKLGTWNNFTLKQSIDESWPYESIVMSGMSGVVFYFIPDPKIIYDHMWILYE